MTYTRSLSRRMGRAVARGEFNLKPRRVYSKHDGKLYRVPQPARPMCQATVTRRFQKGLHRYAILSTGTLIRESYRR